MGRIRSNGSNDNELEFISGVNEQPCFFPRKTIADISAGLKGLLGDTESRSHQNSAQMRH